MSAPVTSGGNPAHRTVSDRQDDICVKNGSAGALRSHHQHCKLKHRNVAAGSRVAFVVDDLRPGDGWNPRYLEIRGTAEALNDVEPPQRGFSREVIKIHPDWVRSFGLDAVD